jgi:hypothetical protein
MAYLLDANVFIQAKNLHYGFDFCPAFWDWLVVKFEAEVVFSVEKVGDEIAAGDDDLAAWAVARGSSFFLPPDAATIPALTNVGSWVTGQPYDAGAVNIFLQGADYYLVAFALAHGHIVVTHEKPSDGVRKVKIPNVCIGFGLRCITPFEMLRRERARFVLAGT